MVQTHVVGICGSLRDSSYTRLALSQALEASREAGATADLIDLREYELPMLNRDHDEPEEAAQLAEAIREADAILLGTPMYHGSYSSPLKTALDYCGFDEFENSTVGLLAVSGGSFPLLALEHLRSVCRALNAWVLPHQAAIPNSHRQFENGKFADEAMLERVQTLGERIVEFAHIEPDPACHESLENAYAQNMP